MPSQKSLQWLSKEYFYPLTLLYFSLKYYHYWILYSIFICLLSIYSTRTKVLWGQRFCLLCSPLHAQCLDQNPGHNRCSMNEVLPYQIYGIYYLRLFNFFLIKVFLSLPSGVSIWIRRETNRNWELLFSLPHTVVLSFPYSPYFLCI